MKSFVINIFSLAAIIIFSLPAFSQQRHLSFGLPRHQIFLNPSPLQGTRAIQHRPAQKTTATYSRLIANFDANGTAGGTLQNRDSSTYRYIYNSARTGFDLHGNEPAVLSNGMYLNAKFDTGTTWQWDVPSSSYKPYFRILDSFNATNNLQVTIYQNWTAGTWVNSSRSVEYYNSAGYDTLSVLELWNSTTSSWDKSSRNIYTYDGAGNLLTETDQYWDAAGNAWLNEYFTTSTYDGMNNMIMEIQQKWAPNLNAWRNYFKDIFTYNSANLETDVKSFYFDTLNNIFTNSYHATFYYNGSNQVIAATNQNGSGSTWTNNDSTSYTALNGIGNAAVTFNYTWTSGNWILSSRTTNTYTTSNYASLSVTEQWNGSAFTNVWRSFVTYNSYDQPTIVYSENWNGTAWVINASSSLKRYYYEIVTTGVANATAPTAMDVYLFPVPASEKLMIAVNLQMPQQLKGVIYDAAGRVVAQWKDGTQGMYLKDISTAELSPGAYYLQLQSGDAKWCKQFTVQH